MLEFEPFSMKCTFGNSVDKECNRVDKLLSKRDSNESFRILKCFYIYNDSFENFFQQGKYPSNIYTLIDILKLLNIFW